MPHYTGVARLGKDAELRYTPDSKPVANLALAFNYGPKDAEGKRATQWLDASLWGQRAEALEQYLVKGQALYVVIEDVHVELYEGRNGPGAKLVGNITSLEFAGPRPEGGDRGQQQRPAQRAPAPAPRQQARAPAPAPRPSTGFDDLDDDIPF